MLPRFLADFSALDAMQSFLRPLGFLIVLFLFASWGCGGCGQNNENTGEATVTIDSVDPAGAYPEVEVSVEFTIEPGEGTNADAMEWMVDFGDGSTATGEGVQGSAVHAYTTPAQYDITVSAVFEDATVGEAFETIRIFSPVDLQITDTSGSPRNARSGEDLQVIFTVSNTTAAQVFTAYEVSAYLSTEANVGLEDLENLIGLGSFSIEPDAEGEPIIDSGEERESAFTVTIPDDVAGGDYYIVTVLDPRERIADTDRENNFDVSSSIIRVENLDESFPDLCVSDLYVTPDRVFPQLNSFTRGAVLCNDGGADAFDVRLKTYISIGDDDFDPSEDRLVDETDALDVFAGEEEPVGPTLITFDVGEEIVPDGEDIEVWVIVVAEFIDGDAVDSDDGNNILVSEVPIVVTDEPVMGPDIVVRDFAVSPDSTFLNGSLNVTADVANEGTVDVGSFFCGIYLGRNPAVNTQTDPRLTNINIPSLAAGDNTLIDQAVTVPGLYDPGVYYLYMVCDPLNALQEPFRSNNAFIYPTRITITDEADVDLFVEEVTAPATVPEGDTFEVTVRACVNGQNPSGTTVANLFLSPGTQVDFNAMPAAQFDIPNVLPGGQNCREIVVELTASCEEFQDTYAIGVAVDVDNRLPELDETNNRKTASGAIQVTGEFCQCDEDVFEPNDTVITAEPVGEGITSAAVCTGGNVDYFSIPLAQNDSVVVRTRFNADKGDLNTTLFQPGGTQLIDSDSTANVQEVSTFFAPTAGDYVVRVAGASVADRNIYDLEVDVLAQVAGVDLLPRNFSLPFRDTFTIGEVLDVTFDVYNVGTSAAPTFEVQFFISPDDSPDLMDGTNTLIGSTQVAGVGATSLTTVNAPVTLPTNLMNGEYYLLAVVDPTGATSDLDATNNVIVSEVIEVRTECFDPLEPNDSFAGAADVQDGSYSNLQLCTAGDDYYRLCLPTGKRFDVTVNFSDADGDIDLELLNDQEQTIDSSANAGTDVEQVSLDFVNGDQCYYVRVRLVTLAADLETTYSMNVAVQDVDPSLLCGSAFEPNDSFQTASSLVAALNQTTSLDRCPSSDSDFYYVNLNAGQTVSFTATKNPASQPGTLRAQLYLPNQTPGPNKETGPGVPSASISNYVAPVTGTYYLQLTVASASRNVTYELSATGLAGVDVAPSALSIGPGDYSPNDEVRFGFTLTNLGSSLATGVGYEVFLSSTATSGGTSLGTFTVADLAGNSTANINGKVFVPAGETAGAKFLRIVATATGDSNNSNDKTSVPISIVP